MAEWTQKKIYYKIKQTFMNHIQHSQRGFGLTLGGTSYKQNGVFQGEAYPFRKQSNNYSHFQHISSSR